MIRTMHLKMKWGAYAILYRFEKAGEKLPMHEHTGANAHLQHDITCTRGSIRVTIWGGKPVDFVAGEGCIFEKPECLHEIEALEDNTSTLHEFLLGQPEEYKNLPPQELDT